jgi:membrane-associated phospholipid phosphatase
MTDARRTGQAPAQLFGSRVVTATGLAALLSFVALGFGVAHSELIHSLDQWSVDQLMPGLHFSRGPLHGLSTTYIEIEGHRHRVVRVAARAIIWPASAIPSLVVLGALAIACWRCGARLAGTAWVIGFGVGGLAELLLKGVVVRPPLLDRSTPLQFHITGFDGSWPSGHALRAVLLSALAGWLWRRAEIVLALWLCACVGMLVLGGFHTPADVLGGVLLAAAIIGGLSLVGYAASDWRSRQAHRRAPTVA